MTQSDLPAPSIKSSRGAGGPALALLEKAGSALESGDWKEAVRLARRAIRGRRNDLPSLELLARAYWIGGEYAEVLRITRRLLALNPNEPGYRMLQAMALRGSGQFRLAIEALLRTLAESNSPTAKENALAMLDELDALQSGAVRRLREADPTFRRAYDRDPEGVCRSLGFELTWYGPKTYRPESPRGDRSASPDRA